MGKLKPIIHPLFFVFGIYFAIIGKVFSFVIMFLSAFIHEFGHFLASERYGYKMDKIVLMPYGAVIYGDMISFKYKDEIFIALAGPMINLLVILLFTALWWLVPSIYPYTDIIVSVNLSVLFANLLPCYPLDGGRVLLATLSLYINRKVALKICKIIGLLLGLLLFGLFVYSCFKVFNLSLLFFSLFMIFGALTKSNANSYIRVYNDLTFNKFKQGVKVEKVAICENATILQLFNLVGTKTCEVTLLDDNGKITCELNAIKTQKLLSQASLYGKIKNEIKKTQNQ